MTHEITKQDLKLQEKNLSKSFNQSIDRSIESFARIVSKGFGGVDKRFDGVDKRFDEVDKRFDLVEERLDKIEGKLEGIVYRNEFEQLKAKLEALESMVFMKRKEA